jgi:DNA-binding IclR family transcriptional regulator
MMLLRSGRCCTDTLMPNAKSPRVRAVPAVTRAVAILRLLSRSSTPQSLKTIAETLDLVPSTALHIVRALLAEDLLQVDPQTKRYSVGVGMLPLARAVLENAADFPSLMRPKLEELSSRYGVMAIGVEVPDLDNMIVVALARSQAPVRLHVDIGSRFPALISATGRCVAAFSGQPEKEIEKRFRLLRWHNAPTYDAWRKEVDQVRKQGFSIDRGNYIAGVTIVAVPVLNAKGTISHTVAAVGLGSQLDRPTSLALARDMRAVAEAIAAQLAIRA